jgi:hypothetical protein
MLHLNGVVATMADLDWTAAKPVVRRTKDVQRKRKGRRVAREQREHARLFTMTFSDGRVVRPIKGEIDD